MEGIFSKNRAESGHDQNQPTDDANGRILVVDDNAANLFAIDAALGDLARHVERAQSGAEALRVLLQRDFALILLDVKMPTLGGLETAQLIRERQRTRHTPIIFMTAYGRDDDVVLEGYKLGAVDFLFKPIVPAVLRAKVSVFVELQRRTAEVARQAEQLRAHERREQERGFDEERRRWEEDALRRRMEEMAAADRRKDEFLAILGHELRNPLAPIVTGLELLRLKLPGKPIGSDVVTRTRLTIERQVGHLTRLVDDLLDVSRINSGKVELRKAPVTLQEIVEQAVAISRPILDDRGHTLSVTVPDEPVSFVADAVRLTQVTANLLNNAARYTNEGGAIRLTATSRAGVVEIRVADNGRGIKPELLPRIFDLFVQERDGGAGLGLGLALVKQLVGMHGGDVSAHSAGPGQGSEFVVRLPAERGTGASASAASAPATNRPETADDGGRPLRVALVDDSADIRETMCDLLTSCGHTVEMGEDGAVGLALILRMKPDVALVDISMPKLDGYELATRVRSELGDGGPRLVAMSGFGQDTDRQRSQEAGFDAHLVKPADVDVLLRVLQPDHG